MSEHEITASKVEHLLKVGLWQQWKKKMPVDDNPVETYDRELLAWKFIYMCGSNIMAVADSYDALDIKANDVPLFPKIIYYPPFVSRDTWFDINQHYMEATEDDPRSLYTSHAVCVMPTTEVMPIETYDFSPFELHYVPKDEMYPRFAVFCIINNRSPWIRGFRIPRDVLKIIWRHFRYTSNTGFTIG